jgi:hypothetical protein
MTRVKERDFLNWIIAVAERYGWLVKHVPAPMVATRDGRRFVGSIRGRGLPDLFLLHDDPPRMVIAEVKGSDGKLSTAQREFLRMARDVATQTWQEPMEYALDDISPVMMVATGRAIGVYVFEPGQEEAIEQLLRTRVLS